VAGLTGWGCATFLITIGLRVSEPAKCAFWPADSAVSGATTLRRLTAATSAAARNTRDATG
jgi:hypothetical protein